MVHRFAIERCLGVLSGLLPGPRLLVGTGPPLPGICRVAPATGFGRGGGVLATVARPLLRTALSWIERSGRQSGKPETKIRRATQQIVVVCDRRAAGTGKTQSPHVEHVRAGRVESRAE